MSQVNVSKAQLIGVPSFNINCESVMTINLEHVVCVHSCTAFANSNSMFEFLLYSVLLSKMFKCVAVIRNNIARLCFFCHVVITILLIFIPLDSTHADLYEQEVSMLLPM